MLGKILIISPIIALIALRIIKARDKGKNKLFQ